MKKAAISLFVALAAGAAQAQDADNVVPVKAVEATAEPLVYLPAGTEIPLKMTQTVTTKGDSWKQGDQFNLVVAADVRLGDYIVIPQGTKAVGRITWLTSRGAFGKSGKMDIELEYLQLGNRRVNIDGTYRQEGNGATLATVGGVIAVGAFAGFITGRSAEIPQGRELMATLESNLPVALPKGATIAPSPVQAVAAQSVQPTPVTTGEPTSGASSAGRGTRGEGSAPNERDPA